MSHQRYDVIFSGTGDYYLINFFNIMRRIKSNYSSLIIYVYVVIRFLPLFHNAYFEYLEFLRIIHVGIVFTYFLNCQDILQQLHWYLMLALLKTKIIVPSIYFHLIEILWRKWRIVSHWSCICIFLRSHFIIGITSIIWIYHLLLILLVSIVTSFFPRCLDIFQEERIISNSLFSVRDFNRYSHGFQ